MSLKGDDAGFTLIELLVSVVILGFIVAAISTALIAVIHNTNGTSQRLAESHDAQVAAAYFGNDAQSAAVTGTVVPGNPVYDGSCDDPVGEVCLSSNSDGGTTMHWRGRLTTSLSTQRNRRPGRVSSRCCDGVSVKSLLADLSV
jgi:prepilin-type N-terminal cleavage/methylation domain-containing protein